jgi:inhibitor of growth protein 3
MAQSPAVDTPYALALLSEYTHTLDTLPIDLSRNFADLRELDAVLSSSIISITAKIHNLTSMIEQGTATKEDRLWLLTDIAEEAHRLRLGGEDKIRVASQAADNLKAHSNLLRALTEHLPGFDSSVLERRTVYPHVSERSYLPAMTMEPGRRRRGGFGSIMVASNPEPSPAKRKRVPKDDDVDITKSPRKAVAPETNGRSRNNGRAKKCVVQVKKSTSQVKTSYSTKQQD